jgi:hypothetical protein
MAGTESRVTSVSSSRDPEGPCGGLVRGGKSCDSTSLCVFPPLVESFRRMLTLLDLLIAVGNTITCCYQVYLPLALARCQSTLRARPVSPSSRSLSDPIVLCLRHEERYDQSLLIYYRVACFTQDDVLLCDALEEGATLEALAHGVVRFSHSFSVKELSQRWQALLYDPDVRHLSCHIPI